MLSPLFRILPKFQVRTANSQGVWKLDVWKLGFHSVQFLPKPGGVFDPQSDLTEGDNVGQISGAYGFNDVIPLYGAARS